jgi:hypothetical protein
MRSSMCRVVPVAVAIAAATVAVPVSAAPVELGALGGLSVGSYILTEGTGWEDLLGSVYHGAASAYVTIPVGADLGIRVEAGYAGRGATVDAADGHMAWDFQYVEVPVLLVNRSESDSLRMYLGGGGYVAWLRGGTYDFAVAGELEESGTIILDGAALPEHAAALDFGGVLFMAFGGAHVFGELRFTFGVTPVVDFALSDGVNHRAVNTDMRLLVGVHL